MYPVFLNRGPAFLVAFLVTLFFSAQASATTMVFADLEKMIEISDLIVEGTVVSQNTYVSEELGHVVTTTKIKTTTVFYGKEEASYSFTQWGGDYDGKMAHIPGDAAFKIGEKVVLFLATPKHKNEKGFLFLSLLAQSKYTVTNSGTKKMVTRDLSDVAFVDPDTTTFSKKGDDFYKYDVFVAELNAQIAGIKGAKQ